MENSKVTATDLPGEVIGPRIIDEYRKEVSQRMKPDKDMDFLAGYTSSVLQEFEIYLRRALDLAQEDIGLVLDY